MYLVVILPSLIIKPCLLWLIQNGSLQRFYVIFSEFFDWRSDIHFLPSRIEVSGQQFKTLTSLMHSFLSIQAGTSCSSRNNWLPFSLTLKNRQSLLGRNIGGGIEIDFYVSVCRGRVGV